MADLTFMDFDKISDTILYLSQDVTLNIVLQLNRKNQNGGINNFHAEFKYNSDYLNKTAYSIKRQLLPFFQITDLKDFKNSIAIRANDLIMLKLLMDNQIIPWFTGPNRIYSFNKDNKLIIKGKWDFIEFKVSDYSFIAFAPLIIYYQDGSEIEGVRMLINSKERYVDMPLDVLMSFYYYIANTDLYNAGANMATYVKTKPYDLGIRSMGGIDGNDDSDTWNRSRRRTSNNFFNKQ